MRILRYLFGLTLPVRRLGYALTGVGLMALKYAVDALVIHTVTGGFFTPLDYLSPLLSHRVEVLESGGDWLLWPMVVWTLPFLWIGLSMSIRRAADAGTSGWLGLGFLLPVANYLIMILLCFLPSRREGTWTPESFEPVIDDRIRSALVGILLSIVLALGMVGLAVFVVGDYGAALFMGTPLLMGASSSFLYNRGHPRTTGSTILVSLISVALSGGALLLFAVEGLLCLFMAFPLAALLGLLGALVGRALALSAPVTTVPCLAVTLALPILAGFEGFPRPLPLHEVRSAIEIDAAPEEVWPHVVGFGELPEPSRLVFRLGIAYPMRATIRGKGVGAVRHCEFSTGPFVEPITVWDEPRRLAFDVTAQPPPMTELSPYRNLHPPHLDGYLRTRRGEFRIVGLADGRTRLEGSTWYELDLAPDRYWKLWADALISRIHQRVLEHIRGEVERTPEPGE